MPVLEKKHSIELTAYYGHWRVMRYEAPSLVPFVYEIDGSLEALLMVSWL